jgi:hypothetical protein
MDRDREMRRRRRQWQRRRRTLDSNGDPQSGTETSPEDTLDTDEPASMVSVSRSGPSSPASTL